MIIDSNKKNLIVLIIIAAKNFNSLENFVPKQ